MLVQDSDEFLIFVYYVGRSSSLNDITEDAGQIEVVASGVSLQNANLGFSSADDSCGIVNSYLDAFGLASSC
jgi:hypothetical protein